MIESVVTNVELLLLQRLTCFLYPLLCVEVRNTKISKDSFEVSFKLI